MESKADIGGWFDKGVVQGSTHLIVVEDTYEYEYFPMYAVCDEDAIQLFKRSNNLSLQRVAGVYDLRISKNEQISMPHIMRLPTLTA